MKTKQIIIEVLGWYGALAILGAFAMVSFEVILPTSLLNQILNFTGGLGIFYISFKKKAYQPSLLNMTWAIIAGIGIIRSFV